MIHFKLKSSNSELVHDLFFDFNADHTALNIYNINERLIATLQVDSMRGDYDLLLEKGFFLSFLIEGSSEHKMDNNIAIVADAP